MIDVTFDDGTDHVRAVFRLNHVAGARHIVVVGDFNDWSKAATPMAQIGDSFVAETVLQYGHAYRFRYLIDGERWQNDWAADSCAPNEFGGDDSVLDLTVNGRPVGGSRDASAATNLSATMSGTDDGMKKTR